MQHHLFFCAGTKSRSLEGIFFLCRHEKHEKQESRGLSFEPKLSRQLGDDDSGDDEINSVTYEGDGVTECSITPPSNSKMESTMGRDSMFLLTPAVGGDREEGPLPSNRAQLLPSSLSLVELADDEAEEQVL